MHFIAILTKGFPLPKIGDVSFKNFELLLQKVGISFSTFSMSLVGHQIRLETFWKATCEMIIYMKYLKMKKKKKSNKSLVT